MHPDWRPPEQFEFDDITVRRFTAEDGEPFNKALIESYEHIKSWIPWAEKNQSLEEAKEWCRKSEKDYLDHTEFKLAVCKKDQLIGGVGFYLRGDPIEDGQAEIGMWLHVDHSGGGLGTRLLKAMLEWGFGAWGWERLNWICDDNNPGSFRVAEKSGMKFLFLDKGRFTDDDGNPADARIYEITKAEFLQQ